MTYREACARIGVLPGCSHEQAIAASLRRAQETLADWRVAKNALTKAEDARVESNEIYRAICKGEGQ